MPQYDVFVTARLRVETADERRAEGLVETLIFNHLEDMMVCPQLIDKDAKVFLFAEREDLNENEDFGR